MLNQSRMVIGVVVVVGLWFAAQTSGLRWLTRSLAFAQTAQEIEDDVLFDFCDSTAFDAWYAVNDNVMGGVSEGGMEQGEECSALFTGEISFDNNGGFSSVQTDFARLLDASGYSGLELRLRGDGKLYGVYLRDRFRALAHQAVFETQVGEWETIRLPFSSFEPTYFGQPARGNPLNVARLVSMSVIIEYKQEGRFTLEIAHIGFYRENEDND